MAGNWPLSLPAALSTVSSTAPGGRRLPQAALLMRRAASARAPTRGRRRPQAAAPLYIAAGCSQLLCKSPAGRTRQCPPAPFPAIQHIGPAPTARQRALWHPHKHLAPRTRPTARACAHQPHVICITTARKESLRATLSHALRASKTATQPPGPLRPGRRCPPIVWWGRRRRTAAERQPNGRRRRAAHGAPTLFGAQPVRAAPVRGLPPASGGVPPWRPRHACRRMHIGTTGQAARQGLGPTPVVKHLQTPAVGPSVSEQRTGAQSEITGAAAVGGVGWLWECGRRASTSMMQFPSAPTCLRVRCLVGRCGWWPNKGLMAGASYAMCRAAAAESPSPAATHAAALAQTIIFTERRGYFAATS